jgi:DNA-binding MarR family transcriptional regulator
MGKEQKGGSLEFANFTAGEEIREPVQIKHSIGYAIRRAQLRVYDDFYNALADLDTTPARYTLMLLIRENPGIRSVDLARTLDVARSGMVRLIDELEQRGLLAREIDPKDRRNQSLALTTLGHQKLDEQEQAVSRHEAEVTAKLTEDERKELLELLWRVAV